MALVLVLLGHPLSALATPPPNDAFANATVLEGAEGSVAVTLIDATGDLGGPHSEWLPSVWFKWTAPATSRVRLTLTSFGGDTDFDIFTGPTLGALSHVEISGFSSEQEQVLEWSARAGAIFHIRVKGRQPLGPDAALAWELRPPIPAPTVVARGSRFLTFRIPPNTGGYGAEDLWRLRISTTPDFDELILDGYTVGNLDAPICGLKPATGYFYQLSPTAPYEIPPDMAATGYMETLPDKLRSPANDFEHPARLPSGGGAIRGTIKNAVASSLSPMPSVWYSFTPSSTGLWKLGVGSADFPPVFSVFETQPTGALRWFHHSQLDLETGETFPLAPPVEHVLSLRRGTRYLIAVAGDYTDTGAFTLSLKQEAAVPPPANDHFARATLLTGASGSAACDLRFATVEPGEYWLSQSGGGYVVSERSVWWRWTAPASGRVRFSLNTSSFLDVFTGSSLAGLNIVAQGYANSWLRYGTSVAFIATAGQSYYIRAGAWGRPAHTEQLSWQPAPGTESQTIDFPALEAPGGSGSLIALAATASSELPVTYEVLHGPATLAGDQLLINGTGNILVIARQPGDETYDAAKPVPRMVYNPSTEHYIVFPWPGDRHLGSAPGLLGAHSSAGLPVEFEVISGPATLEGNQLTVTGLGQVSIRATQPGAGAISAAAPVQHTFKVVPAPAPALFLPTNPRTYDGRAKTDLASTFPSGLPVNYVFKDAQGRTLDGPPTHAGTYFVTATVDAPELAAPLTKTARIVIEKAPLAVSFGHASRLVGQPDPVFVPHYSGFAVGEDASFLAPTRPVGVTTAKPSSPAGEYPITFRGGLDANYRFVLGGAGTLLVRGFGGAYETLLFADEVPLGRLLVTVPSNALAFTGLLDLAAEPGPVAVRGHLTADDSSLATGTWTRPATSTDSGLDLDFQLVGDSLTAAASREGAEPVVAGGVGARRFAQTRDRENKLPAPWTGAHTLVLRDAEPLSEEDPRAVPLGAGHASASIASSGAMSLRGRLADGRPLTASLRPDAEGRYGVFARPYGKRPDSALVGPLALAGHPEQARFPGRFHVPAGSGRLVWSKGPQPDGTRPAGEDKSYRDGFALAVVAMLDPWLPPAIRATSHHGVLIPAGNLARRLGFAAEDAADAWVDVSYVMPQGANVGPNSELLPLSLSISERGAFGVLWPVTSTSSNPTAFSLKINPSTGAFTGSFTLLEVPGSEDEPASRKVGFSGTLRQGPAGPAGAEPLGHGQFLLPLSPDIGSTGKVSGEIILEEPYTLP